MKLTDIERNILSMALSHMEEHLEDLIDERLGDDWKDEKSLARLKINLQEKLEACKNLQKKLL